MQDEVTRLESVTYLQGVAGHGVVSTLFLCLTGVFATVGEWGLATLTLVIAYGIAANGLSMYAWNEVHDRVRVRAETPNADRELTVHRISPGTKADLLGGCVIAVGLVSVATVVIVVVRYTGLDWPTTVALAGGGLAVGNVGALLWSYLL